MPKKKGDVSRQTLWQRKHRELGLCVVCSEPAYKGWRCVKHYEQHKIVMRLRYIPRVRGRYDVGGSAEFLAAAARDVEKKKRSRAAAAASLVAGAPLDAPRKRGPATSNGDRHGNDARTAADLQGAAERSLAQASRTTRRSNTRTR
jgi:hypothetical protein